MSLPRRLLLHQIRALGDLWFWLLRRRHGVGPDDVALGYARDEVPKMVAIAFALGLETVVVGMLVPWPLIHVLDVLAVLQVLGMLATNVTRPHVAGGGWLLLRQGALFTLEVPLASVTAVRAAGKDHESHSVQLGDEEASVIMGNRTTVLVELSEPVTVRLPDGTTGTATRLRFHADDPRTAVSTLHSLVPAP
ncbi:hypothetical protein [Amycolatopsis nigrescens]|uniref:hypothetical protein n=1 Tax=Amycolatopsis nigrescens TaxID=381445 RepID=UPI0003727C57|nr:hypothetical protein [Amycolatopsis nigrescens]